jgi:hypothetical protein
MGRNAVGDPAGNSTHSGAITPGEPKVGGSSLGQGTGRQADRLLVRRECSCRTEQVLKNLWASTQN